MNEKRFGPQITSDGVAFSLWAPDAQTVDVVLDTAWAMQRQDDGWFTLEVPDVHAGAHYRYRIDGELDVPDPASQFQPHDISGPSEVIDHTTFRWRADDWRGRPWQEAVFLEIHVGTFTPQGTYRGMIDRLDHIVDAGFTALELMPLADFPGRWNWGYDGVLWYAPDSSYGRPDDLKELIDQAHLRGLMVFLDVVYNHFGPDGNYLGRYAPQFFSESQTPWGNAIDYRIPEVRRFAIDNALHWLEHYRFDGLRLDAVHAIVETGDVNILHDLSAEAGQLAARTGRHIHLVLENDDNRASLLDPATYPPAGKYRSQWNDDYHHAWHVLLTGETAGYYGDYEIPLRHIARTLASGFAYQGETSVHRDHAPRGEASGELPPVSFVNFLQNHDQIGNRAFGDRLDAIAGRHAIEAALAITLLAPMPPLMFMGEEWGARTPFPFFCDFSGELADAVRQGRRREFKSAYEKYGDEIPDPLNEATFRSATLDWNELSQPDAARRLKLVRDLLAIRRTEIVPRLHGSRFIDATADEDGLLDADWRLGDDTRLRLRASLGEATRPETISGESVGGRCLWRSPDSQTHGWRVAWFLEDE